MKLRNAVAATLGALALTLSMSGSALAAQGDFHYTYTHADAAGAEEQRLESALHDPANDTCINLAGVGLEDGQEAFGPQNSTDAWVTLYVGVDCDESSPQWVLRPNGNRASDRLLVRSVKFSAERPQPRD